MAIEGIYSPRRYARECAVHAVYLAEFAKLSIKSALKEVLETYDDPEFREEVIPGSSNDESDRELAQKTFTDFATQLAYGLWEDKAEIDQWLSESTPGYDFDRLAALDRNILRVAVWELVNLPYIPPAVTINEAIEIAKKYSTAESGRFVNGVLATIVRNSSKANWDAKTAPADPDLGTLERIFREKQKPIQEEVVEEGTPEAKVASRFGVWRVRNGDEEE